MTTATDNRRRILDMLAEGKITAAEAERMIALIEAPAPAPVFSYDYASDEDGERDGDTGFEAEVERESHDKTATATAEPPPAGNPSASEEHVFTVGGAPRLTLKSFNGRIGLRAGKDGEVRVAAKIRNPSRVGYRAWQEGDNIFVEAHRSKGFSLIPRPAGASIFITAPADSTIDLATSNGRIEVQDIHGSGPVRTSNGRIVMENVRGDHEVHTSNGRIVIDGMDGATDAKTSNGSINIKRMRGAVKAASSNGSISFEGELPEGSSNRFETSNGSVKVRLQGEPDARVTARTYNGRVNANLPLQSVSTQGRSHIEGVAGKGSGELVIRTTNGSINIEADGARHSSPQD